MKQSADHLTEAQKACLRLVYQRHSAKEIGRQIGITTSTVNYHLTAARKALGVTTSVEAARILTAAELPGDYQTLPVEALPVADPQTVLPTLLLSEWPWPFPTHRRPTNDFSFPAKLAAILGLAMIFMLVTAVYFAAFGAFRQAF